MRRSAPFLLSIALAVSGTTACSELPDPGIVSEEDPLTASNALTSNALTSNALTSNALTSNALTSNALTSNALTSNALVMNALRDPSATGDLTRMLFRYVISCALSANRSVTYTWTDSTGHARTEIVPGAIGLAPNWENAAASQADKEFVSACLGARTNSKGVTVPLSLRAKNVSGLSVSSSERSSFSYAEGAFWGNVFNGGNPYLYSCTRANYNAAGATSQYLSQGRTCTTAACGIVTPVGTCLVSTSATTGQACFEQGGSNDWVSNCTPTKNKLNPGSAYVITTWLTP